jgi:hypothetical protein
LGFSILNPLDDPEWNDLLFTAGPGTFFHSAAWAKVLVDAYGYTPHYFTSIQKGKLSGLIPVMGIHSYLTGKRGVALPFSDSCEPLADDLEIFDELLKYATAHGRKSGWKYIEIRGGHRFLGKKPSCAQHYVHHLDLTGNEAKISGRFKPSTRRNIRMAEKEGIQVKIERSIESIAAYYKLNCGTRRHHGLPPQPWFFFSKLYEYVIALGKGFVALASYQNKLVAGAIFTVYRDQAIYKYGASDRHYHHLRPNNLVMWEAIRWCCRNAIRRFSFGRTEPENVGLLQYKRNWGSVEEIIPYFRLDVQKGIFVASAGGPKSSYRLFKKLPQSILRMVGDMLYRHVG